ncbi:MAG: hypothetical protein IPM51_09100 [Sphingobacteriaceae bacterium]|nr:hypothetical protein [Sphingobacteriaceae bacterium]
MTKNWLGYVSVGLFAVGGIFQIIGGKVWIGSLFLVVAIANFIIFNKLKKLNKK